MNIIKNIVLPIAIAFLFYNIFFFAFGYSPVIYFQSLSNYFVFIIAFGLVFMKLVTRLKIRLIFL